ncbi:MAG: glutathione S-transferase C-terminal domain-containing protein [Myxococcota bacterium]
MNDEYVIYGGPISLFTRKLEAAFRFYRAPFRNEPAQLRGETSEVAKRADTHQIPILRTPENWVIADTTPLIDLLDGRFPARRLVPEGPAGVLVHTVEEILDEWIARTMVHYRWHHDENTRHVVSLLLGREVDIDEARAFPVAQWGPRACRATGTESPHQQKEAEREYLALMDALERQLGESRYALGDRPTAVDASLLGGLRAHTNADPIPDLSAYPRVLAWDAKEADDWDGDGELAPFPESTPFARHVLALGRDRYMPFLLGNARALAAGDKAFVAPAYGEEVSYLCRPYPEQSRRMLQRRIRNRLVQEDQARVLAWLEDVGLAEAFAP